MFTEVTSAIKATLYERAKKPFTGTFALAWTIINWRILFTMFFVNEEYLGDLNRIQYIEANHLNLNDNLIWPLVISAGLIILLPILNLCALYVKNKFREFQFNNIDKKIPMDANFTASLLGKVRNQEVEFAKQINSLNVENQNLLKLKDDLLIDIKKLKEEKKKINIKVESYQSQIDNHNKRVEKINTEKGNIELEYQKAVVAINEYRKIANTYKDEFGITKKVGINNLKTSLDKVKFRGSKRLMDMAN